jgi:glucans biosynthesis protein
LPEALLKLNYVEYQAIGFKRQQALWREEKLPFQIEFFHPGGGHKQTVVIHELQDQGVRKIPFRSDFFDYGTNRLSLQSDLGYAGFRILASQQGSREVAAFMDASYFRMIGRGQAYGTSARGLALNTVLRDGEEFPVFQQFWIRRPEKRDKEITVYALMDSPSVAGAYRFVIRPGVDTVAAVKAALFPRREVKEFGIAPLSSMFLYGENGHPQFSDFRPEVHDADGLLMHNGRGEWLWHPLEAGKMMRVNTFQDSNPQGFGLMQRDRDFEHYQDPVAQFQRRPSVWVRPVGQWGNGAVELVQLPSTEEFLDNVVAFWVPANPPKPGGALDLEYEVHWTTTDPVPVNLGWARATRIGRANGPTTNNTPNLRFVIDFEGKDIESLSAREKLSAKIEYGNDVAFIADSLFKNDLNKTWRLVIEIADPRKAVDLRAYLKRGNQPITETWTFTWQP